MTFGDFFKKKRIEEGYTLRSFCREFDFDAGNISKIERNVSPAPKNDSKVKVYAAALNLTENSEDFKTFIDLAEQSRGEMITKDLTPAEIIGKLPVFLRNADGDTPTDDQLDALVDSIKSAWTE